MVRISPRPKRRPRPYVQAEGDQTTFQGRSSRALPSRDGSGRTRLLHGARHHRRVALRADAARSGRRPDVALQLYYDERAIEGTIKSDAGAEIRDGIKCAGKIGVGHEALWPYAIKKFAHQAAATVYADALKFKALTYQRVEVIGTLRLKRRLRRVTSW
jgi:hypothetical protein